MGACGTRILIAGQQPRNLLDAGIAVDTPDLGAGDRTIGGLRHHHMVVGEGGDLREVRDDDDLMGARELRQPVADGDGGTPAHTRIDLVEYKRS
ncbi:hypothetical protein GCM10025876_35510 [Demequina litorisediminis]|uniref:Uncharacterized protein n=1 Tax=Demequina litorisediminis TaxID=1849022 RepID=A0ABQ6IHE2_9MICO|nr:hypothetical protein GCM10025876_35510 [Demequina litorisediminis]